MVRVPAALRSTRSEHTVAFVLLDCGHPETVIVHPGTSVRAAIGRCEWECPDTDDDAKVVRVLAVLSEHEWSELNEERLNELLEAAGVQV